MAYRVPNSEAGTVFGNWTLLAACGNSRHKVLCKCQCGREIPVQYHNLIHGKSWRCRWCASKGKNREHGESNCKSRLYAVWTSIKNRCNWKGNNHFHCYGGRGIRICDEWSESYPAFREWALVSGYREDLTIDRIDVDGNYEPSNCRWATLKEQGKNKRNNHLLTAFGETKPLSAWVEDERCAVSHHVLRRRLKLNVPPEICIETRPHEGCFSLKNRPRRGKTRE